MTHSNENISEIKKLLKSHVEDYKHWMKGEEFREWDEERSEKVSKYDPLLSRKGISAMTEVEVHELISTLWAF